MSTLKHALISSLLSVSCALAFCASLFSACASHPESHAQATTPAGAGQAGDGSEPRVACGACAAASWRASRPALETPEQWYAMERFETCQVSCLRPLLFDDEEALHEAVRACFNSEEDAQPNDEALLVFTGELDNGDDSVRRTRCGVQLGQLSEGWAVVGLGAQFECWPNRTEGHALGFRSQLCP